MDAQNLNKEVNSLVKKYPYPQMAVSEVLRTLYEKKKSLNELDVSVIAGSCQVNETDVRELIDYYAYFEKKSEKSISVCMGLTCYINGAETIFKDLTDESEKLNGDGKKIINTACLGSCYAAPVVLQND